MAQFKISPLHKAVAQQAKTYIDTLTKPQGSLGRLEEVAIQLAAITGKVFPTVTPPGVLVFAADHGVVEEGVSAFPQDVTAQMVVNFLNGGAAINVFSEQINAYFEIVDVGVASNLSHDFLRQRKIRNGTQNFCKADAMTREEAEAAIQIGFEEAERLIQKGIKCLIVGEMGIGNTTSSTSILAVLTGEKVEKLVGSGTGISDDQMYHKTKVIERALQARQINPQDPIDIISKIGGFEIAAMTGAMLAAATNRIPILVDGFICTIAALLATEMNGNAQHYMFASHQSVEPGHIRAMKLLNKEPLLNLQLRLGEGSGAAIAFPLLQSASLMIKNMATFESAGISGKE
ncbi:nicotinate-nucleotide--dimethylbenzimidazole phosphoribosyltransferase [Priestia megaterium]|nr:nicotinate-nucleotide--dimethylbenzimidazole phosphoribosyltransferase [Priestia megaterium]